MKTYLDVHFNHMVVYWFFDGSRFLRLFLLLSYDIFCSYLIVSISNLVMNCSNIRTISRLFNV